MKLNRYVFLAILLCAYAVAVAVGYWYWCGKYDAISAWAVVLTGAVILWYTWETMQLRRLSFIQREAQIRPFILFRKDGDHFFVENIGSSAALNIRLDTVNVSDEFKMRIEFPQSVPFLKSGCQAQVETKSIIRDEETPYPVTAHLDPKHAALDLQVRIHFSNIEGRQYTLLETISPQLLTVIGFSDETAL
jgi:hypothetical protein